MTGIHFVTSIHLEGRLVYLHSISERQRMLAAAVGKLAKAELRKARKADGSREASGAKVARWRTPGFVKIIYQASKTPPELRRKLGAPKQDSNLRPTA